MNLLKYKNLLLLLAGFVVIFSSCSKYKSYSTLQDEEEAAIQNYIKKNDLQVVTSMPEEFPWEENVYYKTTAGIYFRLAQRGDTQGDSVQSNLTIGYRFIEYDLDDKKTVRLKNWEVRDFQEPSKMVYGTSAAINDYGAGIYEAISLMKYVGSEAWVLVPSNLNVSYYSSGRDKLDPVLYRMKITVIK